MTLSAVHPDQTPPFDPHPSHRWRRATNELGALGVSALLGTAAYLLARPALALLHELLVYLAAGLLGRLAAPGAAAASGRLLPFDPVYTGTLFLLLSDIQVAGVAVAEPIGGALHAHWPELWAEPGQLAEGAWASAVIAPGASVIARGLAGLSADVLFLALGLLLASLGLRRRDRPDGVARAVGWLPVSGAILQAHVAFDHLLARPTSLAELEATGLTYGFSVLFSGPAAERPRLTALLGALPEPASDALLGMAAVGLAYALAWALAFGPRLVWRLTGFSRAPRAACRRPRSPIGRRARPALASSPLLLALVALLVSTSPLGSVADAESRYLEPGPEAEVALEPATAPEHAPPQPVVALDPPPPPPTPATARAGRHARQDPVIPPPRPVDLDGSAYRYSYRVRGRPEVVRGMGYNPRYAALDPESRAARYDRDFAAMREAGVNTILGWVTAEWDRLLLDRAQRHGLGVILPYDLDPHLDYTDPAVRAAVSGEVLSWVERHKDHPALVMWGPGNEVLHKLVYPSWMTLRGDPLLEARADAFAAFYVELADEIHRRDPYHPVVYRDAEEAYLPRIREAFNATGVHRPWFVYGINIYTTRLAEVIASWPSLGLDAPLLISEFAPGGADPSDRPRGYRELWRMIRARPEYVIGGAPYVWLTDGPEEVDRIFGLVGDDGQPVDGSLAAIGRAYRGKTTSPPNAPSAMPPCGPPARAC